MMLFRRPTVYLYGNNLPCLHVLLRFWREVRKTNMLKSFQKRGNYLKDVFNIYSYNCTSEHTYTIDISESMQ